MALTGREPAGGGKRRTRGELRSALLAASFELLAERGPAGLSVAKLARRPGVSTAAPYRHFRDREELLAAAAEAGPDPVDQLAATAGVYVRFVAVRGAGFDVVFARKLGALRDHELGEAGRAIITLLLDLAGQAGHAEPVAALRLLERLIALAHGFAAWTPAAS